MSMDDEDLIYTETDRANEKSKVISSLIGYYGDRTFIFPSIVIGNGESFTIEHFLYDDKINTVVLIDVDGNRHKGDEIIMP